jgi:hypothetical protein
MTRMGEGGKRRCVPDFLTSPPSGHTALFRLANAAVHARTARVGLAVLALLIASTSTALLLWDTAHAAGPTPLHVRLHVDYLVEASDGHSEAPDPAAIRLVVTA